MLAGAAQWAFGDEIPEWTGNKLHPVQLGIITIVLSLIAFAAIRRLEEDPADDRLRRAIAATLLFAVAAVCFTTVGRLWFVPGPLLLASLVLLMRR